ncbi:hypothetical protein CALCODRAFT_249035 [Calocera cornea HHB12733]|uniref:Uncharacterized protein n=1 Tax=Calocera cornea HHB12733 TaxID=1353952 RepID=A0A165JVQ7_9BASI|nr:hypothetical protein CALCODRAFT_249035 [Calocera cornea HHB12733]
MLAFTAVLAFLTAVAIAAPSRNPINELKLRRSDGSVRDLLERAGPSGSVNSPSGGTGYINYNYNGYATEWIYIDYSAVRDQSSGTDTIGIDLYLETVDGSPLGFDGTITNGFMAPTPVSDTVIGWFLFPKNACGTFRLVFIEHQIYQTTQVIQFRSAAPTITITCEPYTG